MAGPPPRPGLWHLIHTHWSIDTLVMFCFCSLWPSPQLTSIALDNTAALTLEAQSLIEQATNLTIDLSWDGTAGMNSTQVMASLCSSMKASLSLQVFLMMTTEKTIPRVPATLQTECVAVFPTDSFPTVSSDSYLGTHYHHNKQGKSLMHKLPITMYIHALTRTQPHQPNSFPAHWDKEGKNWVTANLRMHYRPEQEWPEFITPTTIRSMPAPPSHSTPMWDSISWMQFDRDCPTAETAAHPSYLTLLALSPLQQKVGMIPLGTHTLLGQLGIPATDQKQVMRGLHAACLNTLRQFWRNHCEWVAEFSPLEPHEHHGADLGDDQRSVVKLSKKVIKRKAAAMISAETWHKDRATELQVDSESDSDNHPSSDGNSNSSLSDRNSNAHCSQDEEREDANADLVGDGSSSDSNSDSDSGSKCSSNTTSSSNSNHSINSSSNSHSHTNNCAHDDNTGGRAGGYEAKPVVEDDIGLRGCYGQAGAGMVNSRVVQGLLRGGTGGGAGYRAGVGGKEGEAGKLVGATCNGANLGQGRMDGDSQGKSAHGVYMHDDTGMMKQDIAGATEQDGPEGGAEGAKRNEAGAGEQEGPEGGSEGKEATPGLEQAEAKQGAGDNAGEEADKTDHLGEAVDLEADRKEGLVVEDLLTVHRLKQKWWEGCMCMKEGEHR